MSPLFRFFKNRRSYLVRFMLQLNPIEDERMVHRMIEDSLCKQFIGLLEKMDEIKLKQLIEDMGDKYEYIELKKVIIDKLDTL